MKFSTEQWNSSDPYEYFMGRWSKLMAPVFLKWLNMPGNLSWLDLGCGTGALSEAILVECKPRQLFCVDPSPEFLQKTKTRLGDNAGFVIGTASQIPKGSNEIDMIVSALALNFFPDIPAALSEMKRVVRPNGTVSTYVWDYADRMDFLRVFWDAACEVDPNARSLDEGVRFPICNKATLEQAFKQGGYKKVATAYLDIDTVFKNFDDYWQPFFGGQGPAGAYLVSCSESLQTRIENLLREKLNAGAGSPVRLLARAIAVRGEK